VLLRNICVPSRNVIITFIKLTVWDTGSYSSTDVVNDIVIKFVNSRSTESCACGVSMSVSECVGFNVPLDT